MLRRMLALAAVCASLFAADAWSQANLRPDPSPRLPPQPGQGLPIDDVRYLERAEKFRALQVDLGKLGADKGESSDVQQFAARLAKDNDALGSTIAELARAHQVNLAAHQANEGWRQRLDQLRSLSGQQFDQDFIALQLGMHKEMVELYQTEASHTTQIDLAKFAITTLVLIQQHFDTAKQLGSRYGLSVDTVKQPPQY